jgi:hypothetical protein
MLFAEDWEIGRVEDYATGPCGIRTREIGESGSFLRSRPPDFLIPDSQSPNFPTIHSSTHPSTPIYLIPTTIGTNRIPFTTCSGLVWRKPSFS